MIPLLWIIVIVVWLLLGFIGRCIAKYAIVNYGGEFDGNRWGPKDELMAMVFVLLGLIGLISIVWAFKMGPGQNEKLRLKI